MKYDVATSRYTASDGAENVPVRIGNITEENGETVVEIYGTYSDERDKQRIAMAGGRVVHSSHGHGDNPTMNIARARSAVTQIIFQSRPYETMTMKNVSLAPTTSPTDVQVSPVTPSTTAPASSGGL